MTLFMRLMLLCSLVALVSACAKVPDAGNPFKTGDGFALGYPSDSEHIRVLANGELHYTY